MKIHVTITDLTRMRDDKVCVAGYLPDLTCVRPVLGRDNLREWWLYVDETVVVQPFAVVEFEAQRSAGQPPHTEDREIDPHYRVRRGLLDTEQRANLLARLDDGSVEAIFGAPIHHDQGWYIDAGAGSRSLGTISASHIDAISYTCRHGSTWECHLTFTDSQNQQYHLAVTDLAFRYCLDDLRTRKGMPPQEIVYVVTRVLQQRRVFLRIGLTRGWDRHPDRHYLQITGIYSFPDYLKGRCFADFLAPDARDPGSAPPPDPLPF